MTVSAPVEKQKASEPKEKPARRSSSLKFVAAVLILQMVSLLFTECFLYIAGLGEEEIYAFDTELGTRHMPNKRITWRSEGFGHTYFDANGMQEPGLTVEKPANTYRVAFLGDSTVEGLQVDLENKFTRLLNRSLPELANGKKLQILNFGTSGYSTVQEYVQLKKQVLRFAPDLVIMCYDTRDLFENWSPPDATLTNLRPVALKVPGGELVVHNMAIKEWLKSPRGRFLSSIGWLRQNSRIWGLISSTETELSFKNKVYQTIIGLLTSPANTVKKLWADCANPANFSLSKCLGGTSGPSFHIQFFEGKDPNAQVSIVSSKAINGTAKGQKGQSNQQAGSEPAKQPLKHAENSSHTESAANDPLAKVPPESKNFITVLSRTLSALIVAMDNECKAKNVKFAVVALPSRVCLAPSPGEANAMYGVTYQDEVSIVQSACHQEGIPFFDLVPPAKTLSPAERKDLFYAVHLTPKGHKFIAEQLQEFVRELAR